MERRPRPGAGPRGPLDPPSSPLRSAVAAAAWTFPWLAASGSVSGRSGPRRVGAGRSLPDRWAWSEWRPGLRGPRLDSGAEPPQQEQEHRTDPPRPAAPGRRTGGGCGLRRMLEEGDQDVASVHVPPGRDQVDIIDRPQFLDLESAASRARIGGRHRVVSGRRGPGRNGLGLEPDDDLGPRVEGWPGRDQRTWGRRSG